MVFGFAECAAVVTYIVFVFYKFFPRRGKKDNTEKYMQLQYWALRLLKFIMGALLVVTIFYFTQNALADSWQLIWGYIMFVVFVILKDMYCANKHRMRNIGMHLLCLFVLLVFIGVTFIPMVIDPQGLWSVNVGCFAAYGALFVIKYSVYLYWHYSTHTKKGDQNLRKSLLQK